jgi:hypothetical protein
MTKNGHVNGFADGALWNSLSAIKQAQIRLHLLTGMRASPSVLASQIELCDVLLLEISDIHSGLARDLKQTHGPSRVGGHVALHS